MKNLFEEFRHAEGSQAKKLIVDSTLREFEVYATLEEEIFYPSPEHQTDEKGSRAGWAVKWFTFTAWAFNSAPGLHGKSGERLKPASNLGCDLKQRSHA